jgi:hypothetical protein
MLWLPTSSPSRLVMDGICTVALITAAILLFPACRIPATRGIYVFFAIPAVFQLLLFVLDLTTWFQSRKKRELSFHGSSRENE